MSAPKLAWGGFKNGRIPRENLVDVGGGKLLQWDAASAFLGLAVAFAARFPGRRLTFTDTYRDYAYQVRMSGTGHHNYQPGGSIHGYARSADLAGYGASTTTIQHQWLRENVHNFGISWAYGKELREDWHFDYIGPITTTAGGGGGSGAEDMTPDQALQLAQIHQAIYETQQWQGIASAVAEIRRALLIKASDGSGAWDGIDQKLLKIQASLNALSPAGSDEAVSIAAHDGAKAGAAEALAGFRFPTTLTIDLPPATGTLS